MKVARFVSAGVVVVLLMGSQATLADDWSWQKLNPFASNDPQPSRRHTARSSVHPMNRTRKSTAEPSGLQKFTGELKQKVGEDLSKFNAGTKRFFSGAKDALTWKEPAPKKKRPKKKTSWMNSLFGRKEPKPIESFDDWWALERIDP